MSYYFSKLLTTSFDRAIEQVREAMKTEGFGVVSEIDMHSRLKEKLGVDYKRYTILGACSPTFAYQALQVEDKIGTMLPCNFVIIDQGDGKTEVAAVHPVASMKGIENPALEPLAREVTEKLERIIQRL